MTTDNKEPRASHFTVKSITNLAECNIGDVIPTSDFSSLVNHHKFIQFEYKNITDKYEVIVTPGIHSVCFRDQRLALTEAVFTDDPVYKEHIHTHHIKTSVDQFFARIPVYNKYKIFPKRGILLYGNPGVGKSQAIAITCKDLVKEGKTGIVLWDTSKIQAKDIKEFIKSFEYKGCENFILIAEDVGGIEYSSESGPMAANSALLSLLDNIEQTFKIPTMIIATTNYPQNLLPVLTNRPGRFDHVYEIPNPNGLQRKNLLSFFIVNIAEDLNNKQDLNFITDKKYDGFSIAHIKEIIIRSELCEMSLEAAALEMTVHITKVKQNFPDKNKSKVGFD